MSKRELPPNRALNSAFKERGRDAVVMIEAFPILEGELLWLERVSPSNERRAGER
jgi:hypothetical protein